MKLLYPTRKAAALALAAGAMFGAAGAVAQGGPASGHAGGDAGRVSETPFVAGFRAGVADERRFGPQWNDASQRESMERLDRARILLREVLVMLRQLPAGERRDSALEQARQALIRTQNAMTWLPRGGEGEERRAQRGIPLEHGWGERASGGPRG
ncbi:hypothetical protein [Falsiroseomonas tokyonensis]|uniref:LTXXQ motif family protein n=1 Tax=Falsiroseomonas tokyonensis TaxID=430521 RepID=A0ABV7BR65_9PROT|nr:hypothetical protein [Falsiroseomonas tokyonensis]MBU8536607.1 hypothetical protein [Falsiroseomonas tokyonensis]